MRIFPLAALAGLGVAAVTAVPAHAGTVSMSELKACAAISAPMDRLACYDSLAGLATPKPSAPAATLSQTQAPANVQSPPLVSPPLQVPPPATAPPARADTFGLFAAEHPAAPRGAESISAKVVALGTSTTGRQTVTLDGGGQWELEDLDPVIKTGDSVTIQRAAFGSFLLTTPNGRTHRARRLH